MGYSYGFKLFGGGGAGGSGVGTSSTTQVLFNSSGSVAGDAGLTYDSASDTLTSGAYYSIGGFTSGADKATFSGDGVSLPSGGLVRWSSSASDWYTGIDSGLRRVSPGLVGVTSGGSNLGSLQAGNVTAVALGTPTVTSPLTVNGTPGVTTYGYKLTALLADATTTAASAEVTIATGNATLDGTNSITVAWPAVTGATSYKLYRTTGGAAPPKLIYTGTALSFSDIGAAGTAETPSTVNTTGAVAATELRTIDGSYALRTNEGGLWAFYLSSVRKAVLGSLRMGLGSDVAFGWSSIGDANAASDVILSRAAAATIQLGAAPNAAPVTNTLIVGESGSGTNIAGANGVIQSGTGTGSGAGSHVYIKTPTAHGSDDVAQTQTTRFDIYEGTTIAHTDINPAAGDGYALGGNSTPWYKVMVSRATLGSKSKALTDATPTAFATFTIADGETYTGEVIYKIKAVKGTARQALAGRVRFVATREGSTYTVGVNEVGTQLLAAAAGTLAGSISIAGAAGVVTFSANFDTSQASPDVFLIQYRFDSVDASLAITPL